MYFTALPHSWPPQIFARICLHTPSDHLCPCPNLSCSLLYHLHPCFTFSFLSLISPLRLMEEGGVNLHRLPWQQTARAWWRHVVFSFLFPQSFPRGSVCVCVWQHWVRGRRKKKTPGDNKCAHHMSILLNYKTLECESANSVELGNETPLRDLSLYAIPWQEQNVTIFQNSFGNILQSDQYITHSC